jgi:hypothetical protein
VWIERHFHDSRSWDEAFIGMCSVGAAIGLQLSVRYAADVIIVDLHGKATIGRTKWFLGRQRVARTARNAHEGNASLLKLLSICSPSHPVLRSPLGAKFAKSPQETSEEYSVPLWVVQPDADGGIPMG